MKKCKIDKCDYEADLNRRYCHKHYLLRKSETRKKRKDAGLKVRTTWIKQCEVCQEDFEALNKHLNRFCKICWKKIRTYGNNTYNNYSYIPKSSNQNHWAHRALAEHILGRQLHTNEVVHHLDENPKNNDKTNLIILSRSVHTSLHRYLSIHGVIAAESANENNENCWDNLRGSMTTAWLETTGANVIKIWDIGQSAAEVLS